MYLKLRNTTTNFYQAIEIVFNCYRFHQKDLIETLQTMKMLLLKALREEGFGHKLKQMSTLFRSEFELETQLKTLTLVDEKQVQIKASEVPKLGKLIFVRPTTNAVHKRPCSTLCRIKLTCNHL